MAGGYWRGVRCLQESSEIYGRAWVWVGWSYELAREARVLVGVAFSEEVLTGELNMGGREI